MKINLPNQITIARLILAIVFFVLLSNFNVQHPNTKILDVCLMVFIIAGITDWLDGYLARKTNQVTSLGRILDPFVDKVLVCGAFIFFAGSDFVYQAGHNVVGHNVASYNVTAVAPWMVVVIVARELLVTVVRGFSESRGQIFGADVLGKVKIITQMITAGWVMLFVAHGDFTDTGSGMSIINVTLVWSAVAVTILSGLNYLYKARRIIIEAAA